MRLREKLACLSELYEAWDRGDFATGYAFHPEVEFVRVGTGAAGLDGVWRGSDEMWRAVCEWLRSWELLTIEAEQFVPLGDQVLVLTRQVARGKHSGIPATREVAELFTFRDGKISRVESYWHRADAVRAAGLET